MGKSIVINGADFSANGFKVNTILNLDNSDCTTSGYLLNYTTGEPMSGYEAWSVSDYIDLGDRDTLLIVTTGTGTYAGIAFYDSSKNFISNSGIKYSSQSNQEYSIPANAKYLRFCQMNGVDTELKVY